MGIFESHAGHGAGHVDGSVMISMQTLDLANQRVLIREDFNVPMQRGVISNDERIQRALPTLRIALEAGARVIVASHWGRPLEGVFSTEYSLAPVAHALSHLLGQPIALIQQWQQGVDVARGQLVLLENVRFNIGEKNNTPELAQQFADLCDIFVMDAFATAHRAQASTVGVIERAPIVVAGPLLQAEIQALSAAFDAPAHPVVAIIGGSKVSTKIHVLDTLLDKILHAGDVLLLGGGIANTFLKAAGHPIGQSLHEADWVDRAKALLARAAAKGVRVPLPEDVMVARMINESSDATVKSHADVTPDESIFDVGPMTQRTYPALFESARTIIWNGPVGVFEIDDFSAGTRAMAQAIANSKAFSMAGGGDTLAALAKYGLRDKISYVSTGGGAFLEYLEGRELPVLRALRERGAL